MRSSTVHVHRAGTLCFECRRFEHEHDHKRLPIGPRAIDIPAPVRPGLSGQQVAHRKRMLDFAVSEARRAENR